jgi:hypothetical protein
MGFNFKRFLRRTPPTVLRQYLDARNISLSDRVEWEDPASTQLNRLLDEFNVLGPDIYDSVIADLERADQLCDATGQRALHSVAASDAGALALLQTADVEEARAIALLVHHDALFEHAFAAAYADRLRKGRSWSAFSIDGSAIIGAAPPNMPAFETELAGTLTRVDGSNGKLKIDSFERGTISEDGTVVGMVAHYAIYIESTPVSDIGFRGNELQRTTRRPVSEGAIVYDGDNRTLDVVAEGGTAVRRRVADSFAQNVLGIKGKIHPVSTRRFGLERLRRPMAFESDPADGIASVKLTMLRLERMGARYERVTIEVDPSDRTDLCARSAHWFGNTDPLRSPEWSVTHAMLRIVFHPEGGKTRKTTVSIQLRAPNGSNLRDQTRRHQVISQKYLTRWGLIAAPSR